MTPTEPRLELAGVRQRLLAGLIDSGLGVGVLGGLAGILLERGRPDVMERLRRAKVAVERLGEWTSAPWVTRARSVLGVIWAVGMRNARTPGMRAAHIHRVDARTGGPVTVRSALTRVAFERAWSAAGKRVTDPMFEHFQAREKARQAELDEVRRTHPDDPRAEADVGASQGLFAPSCCGVILAMLAIHELPRAITSRRQNLTEWVAGIVVVRD